METVAMYWESRIKTYGFQVVKDLAAYRYVIPVNRFNHLGSTIAFFEHGPDRFHLVCAQLNPSFELSLLLVCEPDQGKSFSRYVETEKSMGEGCLGLETAPVELLFFQGPHFGDRFGIADFTYRALKDHANLLLAAVFSCASIYLVWPEGAADGAKDRLTISFHIPS